MKLKRITSLIHSSVYHQRCCFILKDQIKQPGRLVPPVPPLPVASSMCFLQTKRQTKSCTCAGTLSSKELKPVPPLFFAFSTSSTYLRHPCRCSQPDLTAHNVCSNNRPLALTAVAMAVLTAGSRSSSTHAAKHKRGRLLHAHASQVTRYLCKGETLTSGV